MKARLLLLLVMLPAAAGGGTLSGGVGLERETYGDRGLGHASNVLKVIADWKNADTRLGHNEFLFDIDAELRWEPNPEKYDTYRKPISLEVDAAMAYPLLRPRANLTVGPAWGVTWAKNSQQLEEFERFAYVGPSMRWHTSPAIHSHAIVAVACSEQEKDDDRPRERLGLGPEALNRQGCGPYAALRGHYLDFDRWRLSLDLTHYRGDYGSRLYHRSQVTIGATYSFNGADRCSVQLQTIRRNTEINLLDVRDEVRRLAFECHRVM